MQLWKWFSDLKKDAARYRWLRAQRINFNPKMIVTSAEQRPGTFCPSETLLDDCIDRYMDGYENASDDVLCREIKGPR